MLHRGRACALSLLVAASLGCGSAPDPAPGPSEPAEPAERSEAPAYDGDSDGDGDWGECGRTELIEVDGYVIEVPIPCDPYYIDRGDPPPDEAGGRFDDVAAQQVQAY